MRILPKTLGLLATILAFAASASGCGPDHPRAVSDCPISFDLASKQEPLGPGAKLLTAAKTVAQGSDPTTMRAVASAAGLKDDWDRMVVVFPGTKSTALNTDVGTSTVCWKNLPPTYGDDSPHAAYYLFVKDGKPVQAVHWFFPNDRALDFMSPRTRIVYPDTLLTPVHVPGVEPFLRPSAE